MLAPLVVGKLAALPVQPGVYLFKDKHNTVVYVGKAKSLRSRVRSYFQEGSSDTRCFIPVLHRIIGDLDTIVTNSEKEAAILENNLIKQHRPRFNVKLRDDKEFISLRLDLAEAWPRLSVVRRPAAERSALVRYFGPYPSATAARRTLHVVNKHFQLRTCSDAEMKSRKRPCLQYQIKRCPAPCVLDVDSVWYATQARSVVLFLDGRHDELSEIITSQMREAARHMHFELAATYRDQLAAIAQVREEQRVVAADDAGAGDRDVLGLHREGDLVELALLHVRGGRLAHVATFSLKNAEVDDEEVVSAFLTQHYAEASHDPQEHDGEADADSGIAATVPHEIFVPVMPEAAEGIADWLSERARRKVSLVCPKRGPRRDLLALATENAAHSYREKRRASDDVLERLTEMQQRLRLPTVPRRIECCDISHLGGTDTVGAVVALLDGVPDKKRYRTFHVRGHRATPPRASSSPSLSPSPSPPPDLALRPTSKHNEPDHDGERASESAAGPEDVRLDGDDYRAMYEVLARRFRRGLADRAAERDKKMHDAQSQKRASIDDDESSSAWDLPDLFVVDGGKGQLAVALAAARDLGLHDLPIVALAKEKENVRGETLVDRVYLPGQKNPIPLKSHSASLFFLARARDEAHRFSNRARERFGKSKRLRSSLDDVAGLGPRVRAALLTHLGSVHAISKASDDDIRAVPGVTARHLAALRNVYPSPKKGGS